MVKRVLAFTTLLFISPSLYSMDINETISIITEATEATQVLQSEFNTLLNEIPTPQKIETLEMIPTIEKNESIEIIPTIEIIPSIEKNESIEINASVKLSCSENNSSIVIHGLNINLDDNNSISDNGCTDANLGTSAEGLVIFKTRIKPYCKISGDKFSKQYMQEDWDDIYHDKEFKMEILKVCPKMEKRYKDKWTPHLYQFTIEYASDSDAIPEC